MFQIQNEAENEGRMSNILNYKRFFLCFCYKMQENFDRFLLPSEDVLTVSYIIFKNSQTYFKNLPVSTPQDF